MSTRPLLTDEQLSALGGLLYMAFKEIRVLSWQGQSEQAAELADALSQLPLRMFSREFDWQPYQSSLADYQQRYAASQGVNYVSLLQEIRATDLVPRIDINLGKQS